ncbi:MAG: secretin and TonB N-terminal domain-containing protein, partial [Pseudomonadota bacterium]|nr:secretin and TonB N-terminal domain-containing protein [Pseudomonadota bacterium]
MQQTFPTIRHRLTPLAVATHFTFGSAFLASIALPIMLPQQAMAETQSVTLNIPAGSLAAALNTFAEQAGVYLSTNGKLVAGKQSNGLQGTFSVEQGLNQLLQGSGLSYRFSDNNTVSIISAEQDSASTLDPIQVSAGARNGAAPSTESTMSYTKEEISSTTKLRLSPRETPQIVNVVTHQVAEDFGAQDMEDILNLAPGVSVGHTDDDRRSYTARGYAMAIQYDGLPSTSGIDGGVVAGPDSALLDSTEIL